MKKIYNKLKKLHQVQIVRYFFVALVGLCLDFLIVILLKELIGAHYLVAVCAGFMVGLCFTYILSDRYVFGTPKTTTKNSLFIFFGLVGASGLVILNILMLILVGKLGINYLAAKCLATVVVFMWNFFARKSLYHN